MQRADRAVETEARVQPHCKGEGSGLHFFAPMVEVDCLDEPSLLYAGQVEGKGKGAHLWTVFVWRIWVKYEDNRSQGKEAHLGVLWGQR